MQRPRSIHLYRETLLKKNSQDLHEIQAEEIRTISLILSQKGKRLQKNLVYL